MGDGIIVVLILLLIGIGLALVILPIVGTVIAVRANRRAKKALAEIGELLEQNALLKKMLGRVELGAPAPEPALAPIKIPKALPDAAKTSQVVDTPKDPEPEQEPQAPPEQEQKQTQEPVAELDAPQTEPEEQPTPEPEEQPAPTPAPEKQPAPPAPPAPGPAPEKQSLEEKIGLVWFTRIGAVIGIVVAGWFFKYMVDNEWIGAWGRVAIGWLLGGALLAWGQFLTMRKKKPVHPVFAQGMLGLGLSLLLVTSYASFAFYHLLPHSLAFGLVALLCVFGGALSLTHRAESILVLAMLAALANPVMLSTGVDRPLALFAYLLVMTGGALWVAIRLEFRIATWVSVAGTIVLYTGWYAKFFDSSAPPEPGLIDRLPETLQGAYYALSTRIGPLVFAGLFSGLWVGCGALHRKRGHSWTGTSLYLVAAVAAHAASAALLFDHPLVLGAILVGLGLAFASLLTRSGNAAWIGLPMLTSFGVLAATSSDLPMGRLLPMLVLTGGLSTVYFATIFRSAARGNWLKTIKAQLLTGGAGLGLALLAGIWMMPDHFQLYGLLITGLATAYLWLALSVCSVGMLISAFAVSLLGLTAGCLEHGLSGETLTGFLLIISAWFLIHVGAVCIDLFVRGSQWSAGRLAVLTGAGVSFGALFLMAIDPEANTLRAAMALGTGIVYLPVGLRMLKAGRQGQDTALLPLGLALSFFTLAVALLLSGPSITVTWAVMGAVLAWLATRARRGDEQGHTGWMIASLALFGLAGLRMLMVDFAWIRQQSWLFYDTQGAEGTFMPAAFGHPRAWALAAVGVSLLVAAVQFVKVHKREAYRWAALAVTVIGHVCLLGLLVGEARILFTSLPGTIPAGLPSEEFNAMLSNWQQTTYDLETLLDTVTTVVFGLYSFVLLGIGFGLRNRLHRLLGLGLFGLALAKLGLYDIWALETLYKIVVGAAIAALLLAGAFLYGRFGDRVRTLLTENDKASLLVCLLGLGLLASPSAQATEWGEYQQVRPILGVESVGDYQLEIDPDLYSASLSDLADLRIVGPDGREVPFLRRSLPTRRLDHKLTVTAKLLDPVLLPNGTSRAVLDLGPEPKTHDRVSLSLHGLDYLRRTRLESSQDGRDWGLLAEGGFIYHITGRCAVTQRHELVYPTTNARYLRVSILPGKDENQLRIQGAKLERQVQGVTQSPTRRFPLPLSGEPVRDGAERIWTLSALPVGLPLNQLALTVAPGEFVRQVEAEGSTLKQAWFPVGSGLIHRIERKGPGDRQALTDESLLVNFAPGGRPQLRLRIADGDDQPVKILAVHGLWHAEEIVFRATQTGDHRLHVGRKEDREPNYDLADLIRRGSGPKPRPASWGALTANLHKAEDQSPAKIVPWSERHSLVIQIVIGILALGLLLWTGLLLMRKKRPD